MAEQQPIWWKDSVVPLLAIITLVGGFVVVWFRPDAKTEIVAMMVMVLSFYFGSSKGSQVKDETIKEQLDKKP